jgi:DNA recombination protein RmuC
MEMVLAIAVGIGVGAVAAVLLVRGRREADAAVDNRMRRTVETLIAQNRSAMEAERRLSDEVLDGKKSLIDHELGEMRTTLDRLHEFLHEQEHRSHEKFGQVVTHLEETARQTQALSATTQSLREALSSTSARGQWGERMAEDVLNLAGLIKDVNYRKHQALEGSRGVPDYTFLLPQGLTLHMDVKFPLNNYLRFLEAGSDLERERCRKDFLKDVRARVRELTTRDYVDPGHGSVDCMLLFIPNEQVYAFIQEQDREILDDALRSKIVFCSPLTLYAVLAVIRQAVDNFQLERTSKEILGLLLGFEKQWDRFVDQMDKVGRNLKTAANAFDELETTRRRQLERQLDKVDDLRRRHCAVDDADPPLALEA